ncbi:redoxin domain-containing protein [Nonomuraea sp. NBC_00507]|uniref:redoxin domain-containing protein n=1 Tax=Nonomuraea sp. NBC_00507 TaxID=2976002 RepID=UPI002E16F8A8
MGRIRVMAVLVAAGLLIAGCGGAVETVRGDAPVSATVATATPAPATTASGTPGASGDARVPDALKFTATTLGGQTFDGASLAGKPVVFWFWAPWCPKCQSEAPAVKAAAKKYADVAFVGVAGLDSEAAMKDFVRRTGTGDLAHLSDEKGVVWTRLGITQQSTFVFMKPDGTTAKASGPLDSDELDSLVAKLLAA